MSPADNAPPDRVSDEDHQALLRAVGRSPAPPPGALRKVANFLPALAAHVLDGLAEVPDAARDARLAACATCDYWRPDWTCSHVECGCDLLVKAKWRTQHCPLKKWPGDKPGATPLATVGGCCGG